MSENDSDEVISDFPFSSSETQEEEFSCPECEAVFDTKRGMNIHMGQKHNESSD